MFYHIKTTTLLLKRMFFITFLISLNSLAFAGTKDFVFPKGSFAMIAPPVINKDYYLLEFGFITLKKIKAWKYQYNAYVTAALFEDWARKPDKLRAGGLGFKGGVIIPTQRWIPLLFSMSVGFAKTALHENPILGKDEQSVARKDMFLIEAGFLYRYDKYFIRYAYQRSTVSYFSRNTILMMGVSY